MSHKEMKPSGSGGSVVKSVPENRNELRNANRIVVKAGVDVITCEDLDGVDEVCLDAISEQISALRNAGKDVLLVAGGSVAIGLQKLSEEARRAQSSGQAGAAANDASIGQSSTSQVRTAAVVGQSALMALYKTRFARRGIEVVQCLITKADLQDPIRRTNIRTNIEAYLRAGLVPIVNTNDVIVSPSIPDHPDTISKPDEGAPEQSVSVHDNDSLAALLAVGMRADLLILLSDVDGVYTVTPDQEERTGIIKSKLDAATWASERGVATVICNNQEDLVIRRILKGHQMGTYFKATRPSTNPPGSSSEP